MMGLYKLLNKRGDHATTVNGKRVVYKSGDVVSSEDDLVELFPNKFTRVNKTQENRNVEVTQPDIPVPGSKTEES